MRRIGLLLACLTVFADHALLAQAPFPGAVRVNDGWVPCNHPLAAGSAAGCGSTPGAAASSSTQTDDSVIQARTGRVYEHRSAGWQIYVMGVLQRHDGTIATIAEVIQGIDNLGRTLFDRGRILEITSTLDVAEWREVPQTDVP